MKEKQNTLDREVTKKKKTKNQKTNQKNNNLE